MSLIEERFKDPDFCTKTLCHEIGVSISTLHEVLSVRHGTTPHMLIETRRLCEALELIRYGQFTLGAVVNACGFASMRTFRRVFKKRIGLPPSKVTGRLRNLSDPFYAECLRKLLAAGK